MKSKGTVSVIILTTVLVEAALLLRLWLQATSKPLDNAWTSPVVVLTDALAAPFSAVTAQLPLGRTGVVDFTVLVALEGYFCVGIALLILGGGLKYLAPWLLGQAGKLPDYIDEVPATEPIKIWQRVSDSRQQFLTIVPQLRSPAVQTDHSLRLPWGSGDLYEP